MEFNSVEAILRNEILFFKKLAEMKQLKLKLIIELNNEISDLKMLLNKLKPGEKGCQVCNLI
jgi:hypothetical protein